MSTYKKILALRQKHIETLYQKLSTQKNDKNQIIQDYSEQAKPELGKLFLKLLGENKKIQKELKIRSDGKFKDNNDREYTVAQWIALQTSGILDNVIWQVDNLIKNECSSLV